MGLHGTEGLKYVRNEGFMVCKRKTLAPKSYGLFWSSRDAIPPLH